MSESKDAATKCPATECPGDRVPWRLSALATECAATECPVRPSAQETQCPMVIECPVTQNQFKSNRRVVASFCRPFSGA